MGDMALYQRIVTRMRAGESYYPAAHAELVAGDYGTRSVFNWRTPLLASILARLPADWMAQAALAGLAIAAALLSLALFEPALGRPAAWAGAVLVGFGLALCAAPGAAFFAEIPAGLLILLSVLCHGRGWVAAAILSGGLALFLRELAAPYVLVAMLFAVRAQAWRELTAWALLGVGYAAYFAWHAHNVLAQLGPMDVAYPEGWLQWGGLRFILATAGFDGIFTLLPLWVAALTLPLGLFGLVSWKAPVAARAATTIGLYLLLFAAIGKPFNLYWGAVYTPLVALGWPALPAAFAALRPALRRA